jgi:N-acetylglutamate synthase-like GNAT family acetyltransferase
LTTAGDAPELRAFYESDAFEPPFELDRPGVLARLVGNLVAHMTWTVEGNRAVITHVYVMTELRGKRIGRGLLADAAEIAKTLNVERLVVSGTCPAREFFLRTGFASVSGELVREVS